MLYQPDDKVYQNHNWTEEAYRFKTKQKKKKLRYSNYKHTKPVNRAGISGELRGVVESILRNWEAWNSKKTC